MANVDPDTGIDPSRTQSDIWYSRGIPPNRAFADLFSSVGQAVQGAAQTVDTTVQKQIMSKVDAFKDVTLNQFGLGMAGAMASLNHGAGPAPLDAQGNPMFPSASAPAVSPANPGLVGARGGMPSPGGAAAVAGGGLAPSAVSSAPPVTTVTNTGQVAAPDPAVASNIANNPILANAQSDAARLHNAWQQGAISPALFWANIDMKAKELRSQFPGYNQEINQIFNDTFGYHTIAGRMISANEEEMRKNSAAGGAEAQRATQLLERYGPAYLESNGDPQLLADATASPNLMQARTVMQQAMPYEAQKLKIANAKNTMEMNAAQGKVDLEQIGQTYNMEAASAVNNMTKGFMVQAGGTKQNIQTFLGNALTEEGKTGTISDQTWNSLSTGIGQLHVAAQQKLAELQLDPNYAKLPPGEREKQNQLVMGPIDAMEKAIQNKDGSMLGTIANGLHLKQDQYEGQALNDQLLRTQYLAGKISPGAAQMYGITHADEIVAHAASTAAQLSGAGNVTVGKSLAPILQEKDITPGQKQAIVNATISKELDVITSGKMQPGDLTAWVKRNMAPGNAGFSEVWSALNPDGRERLYNSLSSPKMSQAIANSKDPEAQSAYQNWMLDQAGALPGIKSSLDNIRSTMVSSQHFGYNYNFNPQTFQFGVTRTEQPSGGFGMGGRTVSDRAVQSANDEVKPINQFLSNYAAMLKAQGKDPNDPQIGIGSVLKSMGLGDLVQSTGAGEGAAPAAKKSSGLEAPDNLHLASYTETGAQPGAFTLAAPAGQQLTNADRDRMIRTIYGEAAGEGVEGQRAVGHVIANRLNANSPEFGKGMMAVTRPSQFNSWAPGSTLARALKPDSPEYQAIGSMVDKIMSGEDPDNTHGASHFFNPKDVLPSWANKLAQQGDTTIGNHRFVGHIAEPSAKETPSTGDFDPNSIRDISAGASYRGGRLDSINGFIFHHTGGTGNAEGVVNTLNQRGLGVQYVMDRDGQIYRTLPNGAAGAHILPSEINNLSNQNTEGMEVIARDDKDVTPQQVKAAVQFAHWYETQHPGVQFFGHGEVNPSHKEATEGHTIVHELRQEMMAANSPTVAAQDTSMLPTHMEAPAPGKVGYGEGDVQASEQWKFIHDAINAEGGYTPEQLTAIDKQLGKIRQDKDNQEMASKLRIFLKEHGINPATAVLPDIEQNI